MSARRSLASIHCSSVGRAAHEGIGWLVQLILRFSRQCLDLVPFHLRFVALPLRCRRLRPQLIVTLATPVGALCVPSLAFAAISKYHVPAASPVIV